MFILYAYVLFENYVVLISGHVSTSCMCDAMYDVDCGT